jgi:hypothetical protein
MNAGRTARSAIPSAPESARSQRGESPLRVETLEARSGRQLRRRETGWGAAGSELPVRKHMLNPIRPDALASQLGLGEAQDRMPSDERGDSGNFCRGETVGTVRRMHRVVGGRMVGRHRAVNQGSRAGNSAGDHDRIERSKDPCPEGDRASVRAQKRGNARGAKGGRDVEAEDTANRPKTAGVVPNEGCSRQGELPPVNGIYLFALGRKKESGSRAVGQRLISRSCGRSQELSRSIAWRAGCGRSASPVRKGGWRIQAPPLPYPETGRVHRAR